MGVVMSRWFIRVVTWQPVGSWRALAFRHLYYLDLRSWVLDASGGRHGEYGTVFATTGVWGTFVLWISRLKSCFTGTTASCFFGDFLVVRRLTTLVCGCLSFWVGSFSGEFRACVSLNLLKIDYFGVLPYSLPCGILVYIYFCFVWSSTCTAALTCWSGEAFLFFFYLACCEDYLEFFAFDSCSAKLADSFCSQLAVALEKFICFEFFGLRVGNSLSEFRWSLTSLILLIWEAAPE